VGTLLRFGSGLGVLDSFLEFFLKGVLEKLSSFDEEEVFHCVEGLGVTGNEIALIEEGIEFGVKEFTTAKMGRVGLHKIRPCKKCLSQ
jgi:hypothetical protein